MPPLIIHQIVGPKTNQVIDACLNSWKILEEVDFEIKIWTDESLQEFVSEHYLFALEAIIKARNHAEAADIARYLIVHHFGGYYFDWDIQLLNPNTFIDICEYNPEGFLVIDPFNDTIASESFSANAGNDYLLALVVEIIDIYEKGLRDGMGTPQFSGPFRMKDSLQKNGPGNLKLIPVKEIFAYDYNEIRAMIPREIVQPMIHYWLHSWVK